MNQNQINQMIAALDGATISGGCDQCDAYQRPRIDEHGFACITVCHDDWCPTLAKKSRT